MIAVSDPAILTLIGTSLTAILATITTIMLAKVKADTSVVDAIGTLSKKSDDQFAHMDQRVTKVEKDLAVHINEMHAMSERSK